MGYTIYWRTTRDVTSKEWEEFVEHCRIILKDQREVVRLGWSGRGPCYDRPAEASSEAVRFAGVSDETSYDNFLMSSDVLNGFCKTGREPYTAAVVACALAGRRRMGLSLRVDGWDARVGEGIDLHLRTRKAGDRPTPEGRRVCLEWLNIPVEDVPEDWLYGY